MGVLVPAVSKASRDSSDAILLFFYYFSDWPLVALRELAPVMLLSPEHEEEAVRSSLAICNEVLLQAIGRKGM